MRWPLKNKFPNIPKLNSMGDFAYKRSFYYHPGIDLYCNLNDEVVAIEEGIVVNIEQFTGEGADLTSPWWNDTWAILIEGKSGAIGYCELKPLEHIVKDYKVAEGEVIGTIIPVLKKDKGNGTTMLHLEQYSPGARTHVTWYHDAPIPEALMNPRPLLESIRGNMDLYWIDLETSGLNPKFDKILEVAVYKASLENPFELQFIYQNVLHFDHPQYMDEFVRNMHTKNGLLAECAVSKMTIEAVEKDLLAAIPEVKERKNLHVYAGSSIHFDANFIAEHMPQLHARFSHRHYDVSAVKLFCQSQGMTEFKKAEAHRATDDIIESVEHIKDCLTWLKTLS